MDFFHAINRFLSLRLTPAVRRIFLANVAVFLAIQVMFVLLPARSAHGTEQTPELR